MNGLTTRFLHDGARVVVELDRAEFASAAEVTADGDAATATLPPATGGILPGAVTRINFQPAAVATPAGYLADKGRVHAARTNGLTYGWQNDATGDAVNRPGATPYAELNTHIRLQPGATPNTWEFDLPNGTHPVVVIAGDPESTLQTNNLLIEGIAGPDEGWGNADDVLSEQHVFGNPIDPKFRGGAK